MTAIFFNLFFIPILLILLPPDICFIGISFSKSEQQISTALLLSPCPADPLFHYKLIYEIPQRFFRFSQTFHLHFYQNQSLRCKTTVISSV